MNQNLEPGDLAIVVNSFEGRSIGKIVSCISMDGIHPVYGRLWLIENGKPMRTIDGDTLRRAHLPEAWLKKIPKDPLPDEADAATLDKTRELETI